MLKLASWNVNSLRVRLPQVLDWLAVHQPDLVGLQETKLQNEQFPVEELAAAGYNVITNGQKTYNGVALLARQPLTPEAMALDIPDFEDPQRRVVAATCDDIRFINLYVPNGSEVGSDKYRYKLDWLDALLAWLLVSLIAHGIGVCGLVGRDAHTCGVRQQRDSGVGGRPVGTCTVGPIRAENRRQ